MNVVVVLCQLHIGLRNVVLGHLHSANVIQIAWKAMFLHFSIDFVQISLQGTILSEETGYCLRKFYSGTGYHFQECNRVAFQIFQ